MRLDILTAILDQLYADRAFIIKRNNIIKYARASINDVHSVHEQLVIWQNEGKIEILKPLAECADNEQCIRLVSFLLPNPNRNK